MSHVDDGTLNAYLDGELSPVERSRVEEHLAECVPCRDRLAEERGLIERVDQLLALAAPPAGGAVAPAVPPARRRLPRRWTYGFWAASLTAAFVTGWVLRHGSGPAAAPMTAATQVATAVPPVPAAPSTLAARDERPAPPASNAPASRSAARAARVPNTQPAPQESSAVAQTDAVLDRAAPLAQPEVVGTRTEPSLRGAAPHPIPPTTVAVVPPPMLPPQELTYGPDGQIGTTWPVITAEPARTLLGADLIQIPGIPIRDIRQDPAMTGTVLVEQEIAAGTVIQLLQVRADTVGAVARTGDAGRSFAVLGGNGLRRTVGRVSVRISGPLSTDSLLKLLDLVR